jgi:hypothetical protein
MGILVSTSEQLWITKRWQTPSHDHAPQDSHISLHFLAKSNHSPKLTSTIFIITMSSKTCYWPGGNATNNRYTACNQLAATSACCENGDLCTGSSLCYDKRGLIVRGACTDKSWKASECPHYCHTSNIHNYTGTRYSHKSDRCRRTRY